ncbi:hypothetical protein QUF74_19150 [Candidatus Halobeggiatoa sp. HSG11]|nr:hypothetical protein [Candidatus Halobeggiatoa sp. HSG11]
MEIKTKKEYQFCEHDGFPKIQINGNFKCVAEFLDSLIGYKKIKDVILRDRTTYYVFENQYELPLLCSCCGKPLENEDFNSLKMEMIGRKLEGMDIGWSIIDDGREIADFRLMFSPKSGDKEDVCTVIAIESVRNMTRSKSLTHSLRKKIKRLKKRRR